MTSSIALTFNLPRTLDRTSGSRIAREREIERERERNFCDAASFISIKRTRVEEHAGGLACFEVERDLVAATDDRFASALRHVVKEVFVSP